MKIRTWIAGYVAVMLLVCVGARAADETTRLYSKPGSKMRIDGTATAIHRQWGVESRTIIGSLEAGPGFPTEPGQPATPGKVNAHVSATIMVRTLKSIEPDGKPYSDKMDDVMYEHLKADTFPKITYTLSELTLKEAAKAKDSPYVFEAKGNLTVAGVTNSITMPINVLPLGEKKIKISGATAVKMTDFKVQPPAPVGILLKTGDEVKLSFDWLVGPRTSTAAAAAK